MRSRRRAIWRGEMRAAPVSPQSVGCLTAAPVRRPASALARFPLRRVARRIDQCEISKRVASSAVRVLRELRVLRPDGQACGGARRASSVERTRWPTGASRRKRAEYLLLISRAISARRTTGLDRRTEGGLVEWPLPRRAARVQSARSASSPFEVELNGLILGGCAGLCVFVEGKPSPPLPRAPGALSCCVTGALRSLFGRVL